MNNLKCPDCGHSADEHLMENSVVYGGCMNCECKKEPLDIYRTAYADLALVAEAMADALKRIEPQIKGILPIQDVKSALSAYEALMERNGMK